MSAYNWRKGTRRGPGVSQEGAGKRIESADGTRWAYSRNRKMGTGNGTYIIVESWVLKFRDVDGKVVTSHGDAYEADAREWTGVAGWPADLLEQQA